MPLNFCAISAAASACLLTLPFRSQANDGKRCQIVVLIGLLVCVEVSFGKIGPYMSQYVTKWYLLEQIRVPVEAYSFQCKIR